jgi:hypothetical protein
MEKAYFIRFLVIDQGFGKLLKIFVFNSCIEVGGGKYLNIVRINFTTSLDHKVAVLLFKYPQRVLAILKRDLMLVHLTVNATDIHICLSEIRL